MTKAEKIAWTLSDQAKTITLQRATILNHGSDIRELQKEIEVMKQSHENVLRQLEAAVTAEQVLRRSKEEDRTLIMNLMEYIARKFQL